MDELSTQFLSPHWISPLVCFHIFFPGRASHRAHPPMQTLGLVGLGGGCGGEATPMWVFNMTGCLQITAKDAHNVLCLNGQMSQCHGPALSWHGHRGEVLECVGGWMEKKSQHLCISLLPRIWNHHPCCIRDLIACANKVLLLPILQEKLWNSHRWILLWIQEISPGWASLYNKFLLHLLSKGRKIMLTLNYFL